MNLLNLLVFLILSYGSLGNTTGKKPSIGNDEMFYNEFRNYYFTPQPSDYSELLASEEFKKDFLEKNMENEFNILFESEFPENHDLNDLIRFNDGSTRKLLLDHPIGADHSNFTFDYDNPEPKPSPVFIRRQVNDMTSSEEENDPFQKIISPFSKTYLPNNYNHSLNGNLPFSVKNGSSVEKLEGNYLVESPRYYQISNPLFRDHQDQTKRTPQDKANSEAIDERLKKKKNHKKNPCRMYLQFLKYAFKELDKNSEYYDEVEEEYNDWEADASRQVFSTQLLGPTLYIDNSGRVFQVNSQGNSIQSVDRYLPTSRESEKNLIGQNFMTTTSPKEQKVETVPPPPIYNSFILSYDRLPELMNKNLEIPASDEYTHPPTMPTPTNREAPVTESPILLTTTPFPSSPDQPNQEIQRKSNLPLKMDPNVNFTSDGPPAYLQKSENSTTESPPKSQNHIQANSKVFLENKSKHDSKEPDCNDKMLPCPDTFNITYPLNGYCNRYVSCESGVAIRRTCENGFHFNVITKSCDLPHNSICSYVCPESSGHFGIPGDCSGYFICENFIAEYRMCPPRMHWDVKTNSCTFAALSSCPMKCSKPDEIKAYKGDCKAYVICHNGVPFYHRCPSNFIFDSENQTCVPENLYNCKDNPKLITKNLNPSHLCKNVDDKLGENSWCKGYNSSEHSGPEEKFISIKETLLKI